VEHFLGGEELKNLEDSDGNGVKGVLRLRKPLLFGSEKIFNLEPGVLGQFYQFSHLLGPTFWALGFPFPNTKVPFKGTLVVCPLPIIF